MEDTASLVNEHPFDQGLQMAFLASLKQSADVVKLHVARSLSLQFVDLDDSEWIGWIAEARTSQTQHLAEVLSKALLLHPSPTVLASCIEALSCLVSSGWNEWSVFKPRPTAQKSAMRFVENALDLVSLFPDSSTVWQAARVTLSAFGEPPEGVRKLFVRQLQAVPHSSEDSENLLTELRAYESTHSLEEIAVDTTFSRQLFVKWKDSEREASEYPSVWAEMIDRRSQSDPDEYMASLLARSVLVSPRDSTLWRKYIDYTRMRSKDELQVMRILNRAVRNCPFDGYFWEALARAASAHSPEEYEQAILLGTSALREPPAIASAENHHYLCNLLLFDCKSKIVSSNAEDIRECFSTTISILSEISASVTVTALLAWLHAESFEPKLRDSEESVVIDLVSEFLTNMDFEEKRLACSPLQWVQLAWILQHNQDFSENVEAISLCRSIYQTAVDCLASSPKLKQIVIQDWILFEGTFGSVEEVSTLRDQLHKPAPPAPKKPERPSARAQPEKKRVRKEEEKKQRPNAEVVFVTNLSFGVDEFRLTKFFDTDHSVGTPKKVVIVRDSLGKSKGFGYAEFATAAQADEAIALSGNDLEGRKLAITPSNRPITDKRPVVEPPTTFESEKEKTNDYFRNLVLSRQKK